MGHAWIKTALPLATLATALAQALPATAAQVIMTPTTISSALAQVRPGDTLVLQGDFTSRLVIMNRDFGNVTIDGSQARLLQGMQLRNIHNVSFSRLNVGQAGQSTINRFAINMDLSSHVSFANINVQGNGGTAGTGLRVHNSQFVTVRDSRFEGLMDGLTMITVPNSLVTRNQFVGGGSDGLKLVDSQRVILSGNSCTGFVAVPGAHPDCMQFWSRVDRPLQSDIYVLNNLVIGDQQGFASFDPEPISGTRFTFAGNYVAINRAHGVSCIGCTDSRFEDNVLVSLPDSSRLAGLHAPSGQGNSFSNNLRFDLRGINSPLSEILPSRLYSAIVPSIADQVGSQFDSREWRVSDGMAAQSFSAPPAPEPASWLMMLVGFALVGRTMRRRPGPPTVLA